MLYCLNTDQDLYAIAARDNETATPFERDALRQLFVRDSQIKERERRNQESRRLARQQQAQKKFYRGTLELIFRKVAQRGDAPQVNLNRLLMGANLTYKTRHGHDSALPSADPFGMTFVLTDPQYPNRAIIASYDHHAIERLKDFIQLLNPGRNCSNKLAPTIDYCMDTYSSTPQGTPKASGRLLVIRNFSAMNLEAIEADSRLSGYLFRESYLDIARQLTQAADPQEKKAASKPRLAPNVA